MLNGESFLKVLMMYGRRATDDSKEVCTDTFFQKILYLLQKQKVELFYYPQYILMLKENMKIPPSKKRVFPVKTLIVGDTGVEPVTSTTSMWRSTN